MTIESNLNNSKALSEVAKNQQTDPLEVLDNLKNFLEHIEQQDEQKAAAFKQAIMVLAAPNSIAVSSNEDVHLSADGQISQSAGDSINISTQKSLIAHAQSKISLFAAQDGLRAYAGKGKAEIHAHTDGIDIFARKGIQIISTEDSVEIIANKKIILKGGESQLVIEAGGIFPTTPKLFESKAQQHLFKSGERVHIPLPYLPKEQKQKYGLWFDVMDNLGNKLPSGTEYIIFDENDKEIERGKLDKTGLVKLETEEPSTQYKIHVVV